MMEFLHRSLVLIALVCLVACLPQAPANCLLNVPSKDKLDGIPKVNTEDVKTDLGVPGIKDVPGEENLNGIPKVNTEGVNTDLGVPGIKDVPDKENLNGIPKVNTEVAKTDLGIPGIKGKENLNGIPKVNTEEVKRDLGIPGIKRILKTIGIGAPSVAKAGNVQGLAGKKSLLPSLPSLPSLKKTGIPALKLLELIQVVGDKMIVSSGKSDELEKSKAACQAIGGRIATPKNEAENNGISFFTKKHNQYAYVGLKEGPISGIFQYSNGIPALYTNWSKKEPSGQGQEKCVEMYTDGKWNDKGCNQKRLTVCEL